MFADPCHHRRCLPARRTGVRDAEVTGRANRPHPCGTAPSCPPARVRHAGAVGPARDRPSSSRAPRRRGARLPVRSFSERLVLFSAIASFDTVNSGRSSVADGAYGSRTGQRRGLRRSMCTGVESANLMRHVDGRPGDTLDSPYIRHRLREAREEARLLFVPRPEPSRVRPRQRALLHTPVDAARERGSPSSVRILSSLGKARDLAARLGPRVPRVPRVSQPGRFIERCRKTHRL